MALFSVSPISTPTTYSASLVPNLPAAASRLHEPLPSQSPQRVMERNRVKLQYQNMRRTITLLASKFYWHITSTLSFGLINADHLIDSNRSGYRPQRKRKNTERRQNRSWRNGGLRVKTTGTIVKGGSYAKRYVSTLLAPYK